MKEYSHDVCYVVSHGFAARMLLQTNLLLGLADGGLKVAIITPDIMDENFNQLAENENIKLFPSNLELTLADDDFGFRRMYYLGDFKKNPVFFEKHWYSLFYSKSKHPWKRIRPLFYYLIYFLIPFFPGIRKRFQNNEYKNLRSKKIDHLLQKINPKLVLATYPINYLESKVLHSAKSNGIPTVNHLLSWDNITGKGIFPVIPDYFIGWGPIMREELLEYYDLEEDNIFICGVPHFDQHVKIKNNQSYYPYLNSIGINPDEPYILLAMSAPRFAPYEIDIVEYLAKEIEGNKYGETFNLVVRPHPQNVQGSFSDKKWIKRLQTLASDRVFIDMPRIVKSKLRWSMKKDDMLHLSYLIAGCALCINSGSTVSIDALVMKKPVILTSFDGDRSLYYWKSARRLIDYIHLKKLISYGGVSVAKSYDDLFEKIEKYIDDPNYLEEERSRTLLAECYVQDGRATQRVITSINAILNRLNVLNAE